MNSRGVLFSFIGGGRVEYEYSWMMLNPSLCRHVEEVREFSIMKRLCVFLSQQLSFYPLF